MVPLTRSEALVERALDGDLTALETVLKEAERHHHETVERVLLAALRPASGPPYHDPADSVSVKPVKMRGELAPPGSTPVERVLPERVVVSYLDAYHAHQMDYQGCETVMRAVYLDRRRDGADKRFGRAVEELARVRRLETETNQTTIKRLRAVG
jgi:hypothetical protein